MVTSTHTFGTHQLFSSPACDILIVIILREEWDSFRRAFPEADAEQDAPDILDGHPPKLCEFVVEGYRCVAALLNGNDQLDKRQGKVPAAVFTTRLLGRYLPRYLVNVGIACRLSEEDCELGGVIVANNLFDVTGNSGIEESLGPDGASTFKFRPGKLHIACDKEVHDLLAKLKTDHSTIYSNWLGKAQQSVKDSATTSKLLLVGPVGTGDPLAKTKAFHSVIFDALRTAKAYEMEAYAVAEAAELVKPAITPRIVMLKGLSDDGDRNKNKMEKDTGGSFRAAAGDNAFGLLRVALETRAFGSPLSPPLPEPTDDELFGTHRAAEDFPFFSAADVGPAGPLLEAIMRNGRDIAMLHHAVGSIAILHSAATGDRKAAARWLNQAIRSEYWSKVHWRVNESDVRLAKIVREACRAEGPFREHSAQVVNRLLIERQLNAILPHWLPRTTQIITCLVENTGHHRALERYKEQFQREHKVVIDFDAQPLAELYTTSQAELFGTGSGSYDLIFHYHLAAGQYFQANVVAPIGQREIELLRPQLIPAVERECCYVAAPGTSDGKLAVTAPINANSMLLVVNQELLGRLAEPYRQWAKGGTLSVPRRWSDLETFIDFCRHQNVSGAGPVYAILPQGQREGDSLYFEWCNFAYGMGGGVYAKKHGWQDADPSQVIFDTVETVKATQLYAKAYRSGPPDVRPSHLDAKRQMARFARGDVAMAFLWSDILFDFFSQRGAVDRFAAHVIPGDRSMLGGGICCIKKPLDQAIQSDADSFMKGLLDANVQKSLTSLGWCSGFASVYSDELVKRLPYAEAVEASLARGTYMIEAGRDASKIRNFVGLKLEEILERDCDVATTLKQAAEELRNGL